MTQNQPQILPDLRRANRQLVREFGFLSTTVAGSPYGGSAVHALVELSEAGSLTAKDLCEILLLEKSTVSRLIKNLQDADEVTVMPDDKDRRVKRIHLTNKGQETAKAIHKHATERAQNALGHIRVNRHPDLLDAIESYAHAMTQTRKNPLNEPNTKAPELTIGYKPTLIAQVLNLMTRVFNQSLGYGQAFEQKVAADMADFFSRMPSERSEAWSMWDEDTLLGAIFIDGDTPKDGSAVLHWFVVNPKCCGQGLGKRLLQAAMDYCDAMGFSHVSLSTVKGLDAARHLYLGAGFHLVKEVEDITWGPASVEQTYIRQL